MFQDFMVDKIKSSPVIRRKNRYSLPNSAQPGDVRVPVEHAHQLFVAVRIPTRSARSMVLFPESNQH